MLNDRFGVNEKGHHADAPGGDVVVVELIAEHIQDLDEPSAGGNGGAAVAQGVKGIVIHDPVHIHIKMCDHAPEQHRVNGLLHSGGQSVVADLIDSGHILYHLFVCKIIDFSLY